jgi:hypothetical protein
MAIVVWRVCGLVGMLCEIVIHLTAQLHAGGWGPRNHASQTKHLTIHKPTKSTNQAHVLAWWVGWLVREWLVVWLDAWYNVGLLPQKHKQLLDGWLL